MNKHCFRWHGRYYYLLGKDAHGIKYYLEEAHFDCGWYWGIGYIEAFSNNRTPERSADIRSHEHFDTKIGRGLERFKEVFPENPYTDKEIWKILELMSCAYIARHYSDMLCCGGGMVSANPVADKIKREEEYMRINKEMIPAIMAELYKIMGKEE